MLECGPCARRTPADTRTRAPLWCALLPCWRIEGVDTVLLYSARASQCTKAQGTGGAGGAASGGVVKKTGKEGEHARVVHTDEHACLCLLSLP